MESRNTQRIKIAVEKEAQTKDSLINRQATEQIIKAIYYAQSLLRSQIVGFTLAVNIERNGER